MHVLLHHVAEEHAERPAVLGFVRARLLDLRCRSRGSPASAAPCAAARRWRAGSSPSAACPFGASAFSSGMSRPLSSNSSSGLVAAHPVLELLQVRRASRARRPSAPGATARILRACARPTSLGLVHPSGVRSTIIGQRGPRHLGGMRGPAAGAPDVGDALVDRGGHRLVHRLRVGALDEVRRPAVAAEERLELLVRMRARMVGLLIL